jgi:endonuclease/exonuclease/phosphatase family metal-dependent hydrolase
MRTHQLIQHLLALTLLCLLATPSPAATPPDLRVMSFNIRVGGADQGTQDDWDIRKPNVAQTIRTFNPDLLGMQEALRYQWVYLDGELPGYQEVGKSVNDDGTSEYAAIFYKTSRFTELAKGNFWLHPNNTPGVAAWDAALPRIATWVKLQDKLNPSLSFVFMNTHWDHVGATARLNSATMMRDQLVDIAGNLPVIITGDFNADQGGAAYQRMTGIDNFADAYHDLNDTYRQIHPEDSGTVGTAKGFDGVGSNDGRIDWILQSSLTTVDANIVRTAYNGRQPSDHFAITALLRPIPEPAPLATLLLLTPTLLPRRNRTTLPHHS